MTLDYKTLMAIERQLSIYQTRLHSREFSPVHTVFGNGSDIDDYGLAAAFMDLPVYYRNKLYYPGEDLIIEHSALTFLREGLYGVNIKEGNLGDLLKMITCWHPMFEHIDKGKRLNTNKLFKERGAAVIRDIPKMSWFRITQWDDIDMRDIYFRNCTATYNNLDRIVIGI